ncbi:type IV conjugative transfer system protein TraL [Methylibium petroleiphilum]|uniref:Pilus assembly protein n=1 Tax=Methylibium petroleiphilum (strain ATCC BAA-1232 / LMG 22953 / PM1) TaxID=420662 RepID=A2SNK0_METPP|nr:type IV conjugative transfer system protein TraL [Methylibium petroleiphilum]ABM97139.1 pilus assembly protein [Methylibium petroleiphilum PM1]
MKEVEIPRYVDAQPQIFFWELDEAIVYVSCMAAGIFIGGMFTPISMVVGWFVVKLFKRFKNGSLEGVLLHICYRAGLLGLNKRYRDAMKRDFFL